MNAEARTMPRSFRVVHIPLAEMTEPEDRDHEFRSQTSIAIRRAVARAVVLYSVTEKDIMTGTCHLSPQDTRDLGVPADDQAEFHLMTDFGNVRCRVQRGISRSVLCLTTARDPLDLESVS